MKKILVTGGFGFIGTTLIQLLIKDKNNSVHVVDNMSTSPIILDHFLDSLPDQNNLSYEIISVKDYFNKGFSEKWDQIYHLASPVGPAGVLEHSGNMVREVIEDAYLLIDYSISNRSRLVDISSSEIYGDQINFPIYEDSASQNRSVYAISKIAAENYVKGYFQKYNIKYNIIRFFNVYGPSQKENFVISKYINLASKNKILKVYGKGDQIRSFCHVDDATNGVLEVINNGKKNTIYNVGNDKEPITILKLSKMVASIFKKDIKIQKVSYNKSDRKADREIIKRIPSIRRISQDTNYTPNINLIDGLIGLVKKEEILNKEALLAKLKAVKNETILSLGAYASFK